MCPEKPWRTSSTSRENGAPQRHYQEQNIPPKTDKRTRRKLIRDSVKRLMTTLKKLQEYLASTGHSLSGTTISCIFHMSGQGWKEQTNLPKFCQNVHFWCVMVWWVLGRAFWALIFSPYTISMVKHGVDSIMWLRDSCQFSQAWIISANSVQAQTK